MQVGDQIHQADGTTSMVWQKPNVYQTKEKYNITVSTAHTYFVGDGQWLVHNACRRIDPNQIDRSDYPSNIAPQPKGPFQFLDGDEYDMARDQANWANNFLRNSNPKTYNGFDIHEIQPVKFGGSLIDVSNQWC